MVEVRKRAGRKHFPYAPYANLMRLFKLEQESVLPHTLNSKVLTNPGFFEGNASRILDALRFFAFIDDTSQLTESFIHLAHASKEDFIQQFSALIRSAYSEVFNHIGDVSKADSNCSESAFQHAYPVTQQKRMVALFKALCLETGLLGNPLAAYKRKQIPLLLHKIIDQLPANQKWTKERRERWLQAMRASADLVIEVEEEV